MRDLQPVILCNAKYIKVKCDESSRGRVWALCWVPLIINSSVHLGLQLVGASANRSAVTTSPLSARVLLEVLRKKDQDLKSDVTTWIRAGKNTILKGGATTHD